MMQNHGSTGSPCFLLQVVLLATMSSILSGYDQGVIAGAMVTLKSDLELSDAQQEQSIGILNFAAALGGACTGLIADALGRRWTITIANLLFLAGSLLLTFCNGFGLLMFGRIVMGGGVGIALVIAPVFTAELVPASVRGGLVALSDVATNFGILLGYSVGLGFWGVDDGWRIMFGIGLIPAFLLSVLIWTVPESARWLVLKGRNQDALAALRKTQGPNAEEELKAIQEAMVASNGDNPDKGGTWSEIFWPASQTTARMLGAGLGVAFFSQACGTEAVVYYVPEVMSGVGFEGRDALVATMVAGVCKVVFLIVGVLLFDRVGRRPMLLVSAAGLAVSFSLVSLSFASHAQGLSVVGVCLAMGSFSLGFSPLVYVVGTEVFPNHLRAKAMALSLFITRLFAGIISISFLSLTNLLGASGLWACFAAVAVCAFGFVWHNVPETMGLALEDVASCFEDQSKPVEMRNLLSSEVMPKPPPEAATRDSRERRASSESFSHEVV